MMQFKALMVGMKEIFFTIGSAKNAIKFEKIKFKLSRSIQANWKEVGALQGEQGISNARLQETDES